MFGSRKGIKIKTFKETDLDVLEDRIDKFLRKVDAESAQISLSTSVICGENKKQHIEYAAVLLYKFGQD